MIKVNTSGKEISKLILKKLVTAAEVEDYKLDPTNPDNPLFGF